ncbi:MAG: radical SAM protein [Candidatus Omnitrophica bacterium]|nr:radical SAM protein [Candidatus Omnitrophota bacterium]
MKPTFTFISLFNQHAISLRPLLSVLENAGFSTNVVFFKRREDQGRFTPKELALLTAVIDMLKTDYVMISLVSGAYQAAKAISLKLRKEKKRRFIVWGGVHPTLAPEDCIRYADAVCIGEGEGAVLDLAREFATGPLRRKTIRNLWVRGGGDGVKCKLRPLCDLNAIPAYKPRDNIYLISNDRIGRYSDASELVIISRGCPFECAFCCNAAVRGLYGRPKGFHRALTVENAIKGLLEMKSRGVRRLVFVDPIWPYNDIDIMKEFKRDYKKHVGLPFSCAVYPTMVNEHLVEGLEQCGCKSLFMGIQSPSEDVRQLFRRPYSDDAVVNAARIIDKNNIIGIYDFIDKNIFEGPEHLLRKKLLIERLPAGSVISNYNMMFFPKIEITELALKKRKIGKGGIEGYASDSLGFSWSKDSYTREEFLSRF